MVKRKEPLCTSAGEVSFDKSLLNIECDIKQYALIRYITFPNEGVRHPEKIEAISHNLNMLLTKIPEDYAVDTTEPDYTPGDITTNVFMPKDIIEKIKNEEWEDINEVITYRIEESEIELLDLEVLEKEIKELKEELEKCKREVEKITNRK